MSTSARSNLLDDLLQALTYDPTKLLLLIMTVAVAIFSVPVAILSLVISMILLILPSIALVTGLTGGLMALAAWGFFSVTIKIVHTSSVILCLALWQGQYGQLLNGLIWVIAFPYAAIISPIIFMTFNSKTSLKHEIRRISKGKQKKKNKTLNSRQITKYLNRCPTAAQTDGSILGVNQHNGNYVSLKDSDTNLHTLAIGTTGTGKTTAIGNIIESAIIRKYPLFYVDGKGDLELANKIADFAKSTGRPFYLFSMIGSSVKYNPIASGGITSKKDRIIELREWSEDHYRKIAEGYLQTVFNILSEANIEVDLLNLAKYLEPQALYLLARELQKLELSEKIERLESRRKDIESIIAEIQNFAESEIGYLFDCSNGKVLTLEQAFSEKAVVYFCLQPLAYPAYAKSLGKIIINDLKALAATQLQGKTQDQIYTIFDEFSVFAGDQIINLINQGRSAGIHAVLATQSLSDLNSAGGDAFMGQVLNNTNNYLILRQNNPDDAEVMANVIGTHNAFQITSQVSSEFGKKPVGSVRSTREFFIHPDDVKCLGLGECILVNKQNFCVQKLFLRRGEI